MTGKNSLTFVLILFVFITAAVVPVYSQSVKTIDERGVSALIKAREGKPLFINFWATWCIPCVEEFPDIVKLSEKYKEVEFVGISLDHHDEVNSKIRPFLKKMKAGFKNYVGRFKDDQNLIDLINGKWNGALPATVIYDKSGKQVSFHAKKLSYKEMETELKKVLPK